MRSTKTNSSNLQTQLSVFLLLACFSRTSSLICTKHGTVLPLDRRASSLNPSVQLRRRWRLYVWDVNHTAEIHRFTYGPRTSIDRKFADPHKAMPRGHVDQLSLGSYWTPDPPSRAIHVSAHERQTILRCSHTPILHLHQIAAFDMTSVR